MHTHRTVGLALALLSCVFAAPAEATPKKWNPTAEHNAAVADMPDSEKAWPLIADIAARLEVLDTPDDLGSRDTDDPAWPAIAAWLGRPEVVRLVEDTRTAAARPHLGMMMLDAFDPIAVDAFRRHRVPSTDELESTPSENPLLLNLLLPHLADARAMARLLASQAVLDASRGDGDAAAADIVAIGGLARLTREPANTLISQLVCSAVLALQAGVIDDVLTAYPDAFDDDNLVAIAASLDAAHDADAPTLDFTAERLQLEDLLRRAANEDGELTINGVVTMQELVTGSSSLKRVPPEQDQPMTLLANSVDDTLALADRVYEPLAKISAKPWAASPEDVPDSDAAVLSTNRSVTRVLLSIMMPAVTRTLDSSVTVRAILEAARVRVAAERTRMAEGSYPESFDDIPRSLQPADARDPFTGRPMMMKIEDGRVVIYSVGPDRDDDGGRPMLDGSGVPRRSTPFGKDRDSGAIPDGDFLIYGPGGAASAQQG